VALKRSTTVNKRFNTLIIRISSLELESYLAKVKLGLAKLAVNRNELRALSYML
jgi:hypothetical protein